MLSASQAMTGSGSEFVGSVPLKRAVVRWLCGALSGFS
jgi:hypothetical protein